MEKECYYIDVLHFKSPHMLWVEIINKTKADGNYCFEQIGLYGVLPTKLEESFLEHKFVPVEAEEWSVGTCKKMSTIFSSADELLFYPMHIDHFRKSIFDSQGHKFGEIYVAMNDDVQPLSKLLMMDEVLIYDVNRFHYLMAKGRIMPSLSDEESFKIVEILMRAVKTSYKMKKLKEKTKNVTNKQAVKKQLQKMVAQKALSPERAEEICKKKSQLSILRHCGDMECQGRAVKLTRGPTAPPDPLEHTKAGPLRTSKDRVEMWLRKHEEKQAQAGSEAAASESALEVSVSKMSRRPPALKERKYKNPNTQLVKDNPNKPLIAILPAGFDLSQAKYEVRPKQPKKPSKPVDQPERINSKVPDNLWQCVDSELSYALNRNLAVAPKDTKVSVPSEAFEFRSKDQWDPLDLKDYDPRGFYKKEEKDSLVNNVTEKVDVSRNSNTSSKLLALHKRIQANRVVKGARSSNAIYEIKSVQKKSVISQVSDSSTLSNDDSVLTNNSKDSVLDSKDTNKLSATTNDCLEVNKSKLGVAKLKDVLPDFKLDPKVSDEMVARKDLTDCNEETTSSAEPLDSTSKSDQSHENSPNESSDSVKSFNKMLFDSNIENKSKFIDKIITPAIMVHTNTGRKIKPLLDMADINMTSFVKKVLERMKVTFPKALQSYMWPAILNGCNVFAVAPLNGGKTLGYIPALSSIISDKDLFSELPKSYGGPLAVVVCSTVKSVEETAEKFKDCLGIRGEVLACHSGLDEKKMVEKVLSGCDIIVSTPGCLKRLLNLQHYSIDLRRLCYAVFDDFDRICVHFHEEFSYLYKKIRIIAKNRLDCAFKIKFIVLSRSWNSFLTNLAKQLSNSVVIISAFEECVAYSKSKLTIKAAKSSKKLDETIQIIKELDTRNGRTVVVCKHDQDIISLGAILKSAGFHVFVATGDMDIESASIMSTAWNELEYKQGKLVLICCDSFLHIINATNAKFLIHYDLPKKYSEFCKRFSCLLDNYDSIFDESSNGCNINLFIDENCFEQLPKVLNYVKLCGGKIPDDLERVCTAVMKEKDLVKARSFIPLCDSVLSFGECPDFWHCVQRHTLCDEYDEPPTWLPKTGWIKVAILHYHSPADYSAKILAHINGNEEIEYKANYATLSLKLNYHLSQEMNRRLHGQVTPGDLCVAELKPNFYQRCRVIKILVKGLSGKPSTVLIKLIDEEKFERTEDCYLFRLPEEFRDMPSYVIRLKLGGIQPVDKDLAYSNTAKTDLVNLMKQETSVHLKGRIAATLGSTVIVDKLDACHDLKRSKVSVVFRDVKDFLLQMHAIENKDHLQRMFKSLGNSLPSPDEKVEQITPVKETRAVLPKPQWAHLDPDDFSLVYFSSAETPELFFLRLVKFQTCLDSLTKDMQKYVERLEVESYENYEWNVGSFVLAKFPDTKEFNRARIDEIKYDTDVKCFFVDHGEWSLIPRSDIKPLTADFITRLPFQAIECRLLGIQMFGKQWSDMSLNYFTDLCFYAESDHLKELHAKYFSKTAAKYTGEYKYNIILIDTTLDYDIVINEKLIEKNMAAENVTETALLESLNFVRTVIESELEEVCRNDEEINTASEQVLSPNLENGDWEISADLLDMYSQFVNITNDEICKGIDQVMNSGNDSNRIIVEEISNSDDYTAISPLLALEDCNTNTKGSSQVSESSSKFTKSYEIIDDNTSSKIVELDSDDLSFPEEEQPDKSWENVKRPKVIWKQDSETVTVKVQGTGIVDYNVEFQRNRLIFRGVINDFEYAFNLDLFNVIDVKQCTHSPKGLYLLIKMAKVFKVKWTRLTAGNLTKGWISYDADGVNIDDSDDDPDIVRDDKEFKDYAMKSYLEDDGSDSSFSGCADDVSKWMTKGADF